MRYLLNTELSKKVNPAEGSKQLSSYWERQSRYLATT